MSDSCNATRITIESEKQKELNTKFDEYLEKYCFKHNVSKETALTHATVHEVYKNFIEQEKSKI